MKLNLDFGHFDDEIGFFIEIYYNDLKLKNSFIGKIF